VRVKIGDKYNRITVLDIIKGKIKYVCVCGKIKTGNKYDIVNGKIKSCGCYIRDFMINSRHLVKHEMCGSSIYNIWITMKDRCNNKKNKVYKYYGGRGITVCNEWKDSFEHFYKDMGDRPEGLSLDRIDVSKGYSKDNCRWATHSDQAHNKRPYGKIKLHGVKEYKNNKFISVLHIIGKKSVHLGIFDNIRDAAQAYDLAAFLYNKDRRFRNKRLMEDEYSYL
jgi:hypothetical protein